MNKNAKGTWMKIWNPDDEMIGRIKNLTVGYNTSDFDNFWGEKNNYESDDFYDDMDVEYPDSEDGYHNFSIHPVKKLKSNPFLSENVTSKKRIDYDKYLYDRERLEQTREPKRQTQREIEQARREQVREIEQEQIRKQIEQIQIQQPEEQMQQERIRQQQYRQQQYRQQAKIQQTERYELSVFHNRIKKFKKRTTNINKIKNNDNYLKFRQYKRHESYNKTEKRRLKKAKEVRDMKNFMKRMETDNFMLEDRMDTEEFDIPQGHSQGPASSRQKKIPTEYTDLPIHVGNYEYNYQFTKDQFII